MASRVLNREDRVKPLLTWSIPLKITFSCCGKESDFEKIKTLRDEFNLIRKKYNKINKDEHIPNISVEKFFSEKFFDIFGEKTVSDFPSLVRESDEIKESWENLKKSILKEAGLYSRDFSNWQRDKLKELENIYGEEINSLKTKMESKK